MRTLVIAGLGAVLATAGVADAQRMVRRGPDASYPMPGRGGMGGGMVGHPDVGVRPGRPGMGFQPGQPGQPGFRPGRPGGHQPGRPGYRPGRPGTGYQPGTPGYRPGRPGLGRPDWQNRGGRWIGGWNAPGGWNGYRRPDAGWALPSYWVRPGFGIGNWAGYGLARPPYGYSWSRYYDDAVLIDARGSVYDTVGGIDWDGYDAGAGDDDGYVVDDRGDDDGYRRGHGRDYGAGGGQWISPNGTTTVATSEGYGGGYYGGGSTTVVVGRAPVVTTTTTEIFEDDVTYARAPAKAIRRR